MAEIRVFLVDDHPIVREGLKLLIDASPSMRVAGEAGDGEEALTRIASVRPDLVVTDVSMPKLSGVQLAEKVRELYPEIRVLALTVHEDRSYLRQLLAAGVRGYVLKRAAAQELVGAIETVAAGGHYLDPSLRAALSEAFSRPNSLRDLAQLPKLSEREEEVMRLIANGFSNREAAEKLGLSAKTVETYKARSMEKLTLKTRADIVRFAVARGWLAGGAS